MFKDTCLVVWGELSYLLWGKKRPLAKEYYELAKQGRWEEARVNWEGLNEVRDLYHDLFLWEIARTATYAGALANLKAWYEAIGLKAGPILPPVRDHAPAQRKEIGDRLRAIGVA